MDIFFRDPTDIPLPPDQVRIRQFRAEPWADGRRVSVQLELTPFLKRPNGEITITDARGVEAASLDIIETMDPRLEFTVHLRGAGMEGPFTAAAAIFYLEEPETPVEDLQADLETRARRVVDQAQTTFQVP